MRRIAPNRIASKVDHMPANVSPDNVLARAILEAIRESGRAPHAIARDAGVDPAVVQRFVAGSRPDLYLSTASRICAALGLRLISPAASRRKSAPKPTPARQLPTIAHPCPPDPATEPDFTDSAV